MSVRDLSRGSGGSCWLSIVVPAYEEEGNLGLLCTRLDAVLSELSQARGESFEVIVVDDGSADGTWAVLKELCAEHAWLRGVRFARNFGHQAAISAGMAVSSGRAVITMDADLQHPPEVLPELVSRWELGAPVVLTRRLSAPHTSIFKRWTSRLFYHVFSILTEVAISPGSSDFRLLSRSVIHHLLEMQDATLFFRGAVAWLGYEGAEVVEFQAAERHSGETGYTFKKMWRMATQSMLSFSVRPLRIGIWVGITTSALSFAEIGYVLWMAWRGVTVPGWASILGLLSLLFGVLFIVLGIIGLYVANIYLILQNRPNFVISSDTSMDPEFTGV